MATIQEEAVEALKALKIKAWNAGVNDGELNDLCGKIQRGIQNTEES